MIGWAIGIIGWTTAAVLGSASSAPGDEAKPAPAIILGRTGGPAVNICIPSTQPGATRAGATWRQFLADRKIAAAEVKPADNQAQLPAGPLLVFETADAAPIARLAGLDLDRLKAAAPEAYLLVVRTWRDQPLVLAVGKSDAGVDNAAAWLLSQVACTVAGEGKEWTVACPPMDILRQPFFRGREATLCPTGRILGAQPALARRVNFELWDKPQLELYPRYLKACGFNSVQLMELDRYRGGAKRELVAPVLYTLADAAHEQGLTVSQYIWGSSDGFHWADPKTRPQREQRYRELAQAYGKYVDHIITHWVDEGDEGGAKTPLEATAFLYREYQKINPKVKVTCDAWFNGKLYAGIADEALAPKDVGIAIERWYDADRAEQIAKAGRHVGIWGWYMGDFEMTYGSHLYGRTMDTYFSALPPRAGEVVDWLSIELCFHGLPSEVNLYVAGQKMWDPKRPLKDILLDYCGAVYGRANAEVMQRVYETVEAGQKEVRYGMVQHDRYPQVLGAEEFTLKSKQVLADLEKVQLPVGWKPNFATVVPPSDDLESLKKSLQAFVQGKAP